MKTFFNWLLRAATAACFVAATATASAQTTYTWTGSIDTDYQVAGNWSPPRTAPAANDILRFNSGTTVTVTNMATETIGEFRVENAGTWVRLSSLSTAKTLTINGGASAEDLFVAAGATLELTGNINTQIPLAATATGGIYGDVLFTPTAASIVHNIRSGAADAIQVYAGGSLQMAPVSTGSQNGVGGTSGVANGIRFRSGSAYYQGGTSSGVRNGGTGTNPFGLTAPASLVVFDSGSTYVTWDSIPAISGRTYGNFIWRNTAAQTVGGGSQWTVQNNLIVRRSGTTGQGNFNLTAQTGPIVVQGDVIVEPGGGIFNATPAPTSPVQWSFAGNVDVQDASRFTAPTSPTITIQLNGTAAQTVNFAEKVLPNLTMNNASGVTLTSSVVVAGALTLTAGNVDTGSHLLTVGTSPTATGSIAGSGGRVIGTLRRWVAAATGAVDFPIGTASQATGASVNFTVAPTSGGTLTARFVSGSPGTSGLPLVDTDATSLNNIGSAGVWEIVAGAGLAGGTYDLSLTANGFTAYPDASKMRIVKRTNNTSAWTLDGLAGSNAFPVIVRTGLVGFSEFGIAEPPPASVSDWSIY
ncbi:MAG: hypothetical protein N2111_09945 [Candidatus Sumerlaeaceae bacterium]|nr:hypothetical protein [Candidatus Sumerlaeaceae bacterium]